LPVNGGEDSQIAERKSTVQLRAPDGPTAINWSLPDANEILSTLEIESDSFSRHLSTVDVVTPRDYGIYGSPHPLPRGDTDCIGTKDYFLY
jgi:hypothetical protein